MKSYTFNLPDSIAHLQTNSIVFLCTMWNGYAKVRSGGNIPAKDVHQALFQKYGDSIKVWSRRGHFLANCGYLKEPGSHLGENYVFTDKFRELFQLYEQDLGKIVLEHEKESKRLRRI